jgi:hypothetical protein
MEAWLHVQQSISQSVPTSGKMEKQEIGTIVGEDLHLT